MDSKVTLSFDEAVINEAKKFAEDHHVSLSRLTEFVYRKMTSKKYKSLEDLPIADWVSMVSEGQAVYITKARSRKKLKDEYFKSRR
jgi:hypothetical protein